jgi:N-acetylmuramoyl-L-alanine amidase
MGSPTQAAGASVNNRKQRARGAGRLLSLVFLPLFALAGSQLVSGASAAPEPERAAALCNRDRFRVVIDVGHSREAPGALSARGIPEYEFNLALAKQIEEKLRQAGFAHSVLLITGGPARSALLQRVARANAMRADLLLSIHHDSVPAFLKEEWEYDGHTMRFCDRFKGHSIFVSYDNRARTDSIAFAKLLGRQMKARGLEYTPHYARPLMGWWQRELIDAETGVYRFDQLLVLRKTRMPAVLLEAGSIVNREEEPLLGSAERRALIAAAAADAVERFCAIQSLRKPGGLTPARLGAPRRCRASCRRG